MTKTLNLSDTTKVLASNYIGNLAYMYKGKPFVIPITYYYDASSGNVISYSAEGQKIRAMRESKNVSIGISEIDAIDSWNSVLAQGTFKELSGSTAKAQLHVFSLGVKDLIIDKEHRKLDFIDEFSSKMDSEDIPIVFQINIEKLTGKSRHN